MTAAALSSKKIALGRDTKGGGLMVDCTEKLKRSGIRVAALDGDCALSGRREDLFNDRDVQPRRKELTAESVKPSLGQQQAVKRRICGKLTQAGRHITANFHDPEVLTQEQDLHLPARARGGNNRSDGESGKATRLFGNENIRGVGALKDGAKDKLTGLVGRQIFQAVDRRVDPPGDQSFLEFLCEEPSVERARKAQIKILVTSRLDALDLNRQSGVSRTEFVCDDLGLRECEIAAARSKNDLIHGPRGYVRSSW